MVTLYDFFVTLLHTNQHLSLHAAVTATVRAMSADDIARLLQSARDFIAVVERVRDHG